MNRAAVMFPNMRGEIDMGAIFIGSDQAFYEWCNDLFDHDPGSVKAILT